jgi:hypothetical protein
MNHNPSRAYLSDFVRIAQHFLDRNFFDASPLHPKQGMLGENGLG